MEDAHLMPLVGKEAHHERADEARPPEHEHAHGRSIPRDGHWSVELERKPSARRSDDPGHECLQEEKLVLLFTPQTKLTWDHLPASHDETFAYCVSGNRSRMRASFTSGICSTRIPVGIR